MIEVRKRLMVTISAEEFQHLIDLVSAASEHSHYGASYKESIYEELKPYRDALNNAGYIPKVWPD
ncbi:MAG: hypothetical protein IJJ23_03705 [Clostridia bacterium]|nr:hypothetical protein [Clostridia bacterium]